jgi:hypothetical protein
VLNFVLSACRPNFTQVACTRWKVEQVWCRNLPTFLSHCIASHSIKLWSTLCNIHENTLIRRREVAYKIPEKDGTKFSIQHDTLLFV